MFLDEFDKTNETLKNLDNGQILKVDYVVIGLSLVGSYTILKNALKFAYNIKDR